MSTHIKKPDIQVQYADEETQRDKLNRGQLVNHYTVEGDEQHEFGELSRVEEADISDTSSASIDNLTSPSIDTSTSESIDTYFFHRITQNP